MQKQAKKTLHPKPSQMKRVATWGGSAPKHRKPNCCCGRTVKIRKAGHFSESHSMDNGAVTVEFSNVVPFGASFKEALEVFRKSLPPCLRDQEFVQYATQRAGAALKSGPWSDEAI